MPKIVEIIGPSGSGKSSVYNGLKKRWEYGFNWVTYDHLKYSPEAYLGKILQRGVRVLKNVIPRKNPDVAKPAIKEEWNFVVSNNNYFLGKEQKIFKSILMDLIEEHCRVDFGGTDKRFITAYMMMWSMGRIETVKSIKNDDRYCILDQGEGLISRLMHLNSPSFDETALDLYLKHVPYPDVLFYLNANPDLIIKRVKERDRSSSLHEGMSDSEIRQYTEKTNDFLYEATVFLENKGVDVHRIDSSQAIDQVVIQIADRLSSKKS